MKRLYLGLGDATETYYRVMEQLCLNLLPLYATAADMPANYFDKFLTLLSQR